MTLIERYQRLTSLKFSFAKNNEFAKAFAFDLDACSMYLYPGFGLGIPSYLSAENQLRGVFTEVVKLKGTFFFNISGVDLKKARKGFSNYDEAENNNQITEWELFMILTNKDYLKNTIFHNGKIQFKKRLLWKSIMT
jgi:hypothetical protein